MSVKTKIKHFWDRFEKEEAAIRLAFAKDEHIELVESIKSYAFDEFALNMDITSDGEFCELSFFPEQDATLQIIAQALKDFAPKSLVDFWIINAYRQPMDDKVFHAYLPMEGKEYDYRSFVVDMIVDEESKMVALQVKGECFAFLEEEQRKQVAEEFVRYFIGDLYTRAYVASIDTEVVAAVHPMPFDIEAVGEHMEEQRPYKNIAIDQLFELLAYLVDTYEWPTYQKLTEIYHAFKVSEDAIVENVRQDMVVISTIHAELVQEQLANATDLASGFFDLGGEFGYFYFENRHEGEHNAIFRQTLAKQLDELLYPLQVAKTIGGAIGLQYSYIDLAIFDRILFQKVLAKIQERLSIEIHYHSTL